MRLDPRVIRHQMLSSGWTYTGMARQINRDVSVVHKVLNSAAASRPTLAAIRAVLLEDRLKHNGRGLR